MKLTKTQRRIDWGTYLFAFVAAVVIFGIGLWIGLSIEQEVSQGIMASMERTRQQIAAIEMMLLLEDDGTFCDLFDEAIERIDRETFEFGKKIGYMEERKGADLQLKADYMLLELRDYLLIKNFENRCGKNLNVVLYFLSSSNCTQCGTQGAELTQAKESVGIRVYSFDADVSSTAVQALIGKYNITAYPSLVIGEKGYSGLMAAEQIIAILGE